MRAAEQWVRDSINTFECWSLKMASQWLPKTLQDLRPSPNQACQKCGQELVSPSTYIFDANQFYEQVKTEQVVSSLREIMSHSPVAHFACVQSGQRRRAHLATSQWACRKGFLGFSKEDVIAAVAGALQIRVAKLGLHHWTLTDGVPTGGVASKLSTAIVLGLQEHMWQNNFANQARVWT